jgi:hypothetical protein
MHDTVDNPAVTGKRWDVTRLVTHAAGATFMRLRKLQMVHMDCNRAV